MLIIVKIFLKFNQYYFIYFVMKIKLYAYQIILGSFIYYIYNFLYIKIEIYKKLDPLIIIIRRDTDLNPGRRTVCPS